MDLKYKRNRATGIIRVGIKPFKGRTRWVSLKTQSMAEAKILAHQAKLHKIQALENANVLTNLAVASIKQNEIPQVGEAIEKFLERQALKGKSAATIAGHRSILTQWARQSACSALLTCDVGAGHFQKFYNPDDGTKLSTLRHREVSCSAFCDFCVDAGYMPSSKARAVGIDRSNLGQEEKIVRSHPPFTEPEAEAVLSIAAAASPFWYLATIIAWEAGLRLKDICYLEKGNIVGDHIELVTSKTHTYVKIPLVKPIQDAINNIARAEHEHEEKYLCPIQRAQYHLYGSAQLSQDFSRLCRKAGVVGKTFHGLRTAFINRRFRSNTESMLAKFSAELAKQQTAKDAGHTTTQATDIYLRAGEKQNEQTRTQVQDHDGHAGRGHEVAGEEHA